MTVEYSPAAPATPARLGLRGGRVALKMFYTYVLRSKKDGFLYIGFSENLKERIEEHDSGKVPATKERLPFELVYYEACTNKMKALNREKYFKTGFGRRFLVSRI